MKKKLTSEKRAEIRRLLEEIRADLREVRVLLESRMGTEGR